jgi:glycine/D-amino acid oxidase-like deaminating enzyme
LENSTYDYLLIGQGLAGSLLAIELIQRGQRVMVLDNFHSGSASKVAAGIINPVTGHRLNITQDFEPLNRTAQVFYKQLEDLLGQEFFSSVSQMRLIKNAGQKNYYQKRLQESNYDTILDGSQQVDHRFLADALGVVKIHNSAIVKTAALLTSAKTWLQHRHAYKAVKLSYPDLRIFEAGVEYGGICASHIIFCEGHQAIDNPWLCRLPFKLAKGEIIDVELSAPNDHFLNWGNWLVPGSNPHTGRLGATYKWDDRTLDSNAEERQSLIDSFKRFTQLEASFGASQVGIRPTTLHRRPFIGALTNLNHAFCFNGFGSKGCLTIPSFALALVDHLLENKPLDNELTQWL